jgi:hypothetical protein
MNSKKTIGVFKDPDKAELISNRIARYFRHNTFTLIPAASDTSYTLLECNQEEPEAIRLMRSLVRDLRVEVDDSSPKVVSRKEEKQC